MNPVAIGIERPILHAQIDIDHAAPGRPADTPHTSVVPSPFRPWRGSCTVPGT